MKNSEQDSTADLLRDVLDAAASGIVVTDNKGMIQYVNPVFLRIFGYNNSEEIIGKNAAGLFVSDRVREFADVRCIVEPGDGQTTEALIEYKDGTVTSVEASFSEARDMQGRIIGKMASFVDISKRKQAENQLQQSEQRLRRLSHAIIESIENERKFVAKEIHDSVGGNLAAIKFALEGKLESMGSGPRENVISLERIIANIKDTIQEVRRISNHLSPLVLEDIGLLSSIRELCREQGEYYQHARIIPRFEIDENNIPERLKITIFRVLQEALTNALKHSGADTIQLRLAKADNDIELCVTDNGHGFEPENSQSNSDAFSGFGLKGMYDRAEVCNGNLEISSEIGKGTQVKLFLPYR